MNNQLSNLENLLKSQHADYSIHMDNFSLETALDGAIHYGISLDETTPTLILKTKDQYFAAIICGSTRISFKKLKQALNIQDISMADPQTILNITGSKVGEVSLINCGIVTLIDNKVLKNQNCYGGCGIPKATLQIRTQDLIRITNAKVLHFTELRS